MIVEDGERSLLLDAKGIQDNFGEVTDTPLPLAFDPKAEPDEISDEEIASLRDDVLSHLSALSLPSWAGQGGLVVASKERIRAMHALQRRDVLRREWAALGHKWGNLVDHLANGEDVEPEAIDPELVAVKSDDVTGDLFRFATLIWSVPVSHGYGRRMRYLVRDRSNGKLIGIFALADPVFNLRARDNWIGWDVNQRRVGLVHVMDAYVVGAVPPYSYLLGGKLVASLIGSAEVGESFARRYSESRGIISGQHKAARLVLVTVTSALGRSSLYNRLRLLVPGMEGNRPPFRMELFHIGSTQGYGHFHLSEALFRRLRRVALLNGHAYANAHQFGQGPNWRIRLARVGLSMLGLDPELLRHGIEREIYGMPLAHGFREFLRGEREDVELDRPSAREIASAAMERWVLPRAKRCSDYASFDRRTLRQQLIEEINNAS